MLTATLCMGASAAWQYEDGESPSLTLRAESGRNQFGKAPVLKIRCNNKAAMLSIDWLTFVNDGPRQVVDRIDDRPAVAVNWPVSKDYEESLRPGSAAVVRQLLRASRYSARLDPYSQAPISARFDVRGLDAAARQYAITCVEKGDGAR